MLGEGLAQRGAALDIFTHFAKNLFKLAWFLLLLQNLHAAQQRQTSVLQCAELAREVCDDFGLDTARHGEPQAFALLFGGL